MKARLTMSYRHGVAISCFTSSIVRNSLIELFFCGFSLASSSLKGLRSISPSLTALVNAAVRRLTKMRQVVLLSVFLPLLNVQVLRKKGQGTGT